jgi:hypothetical protein
LTQAAFPLEKAKAKLLRLQGGNYPSAQAFLEHFSAPVPTTHTRQLSKVIAADSSKRRYALKEFGLIFTKE